ncbi:hypothetical protein RND71_019884 [Anisodus tanguticus]|uniref:VOC domain-containing protein n=1 Tax=Anisodus tanguticus TaxID=243964 RepID=A0AAE1S1C3_9SOLA|nr:hypothetical protein RND71_019884 [Anisodus tanguticus]
MGEASAPAVPSTELLEWPKKDKRRILHDVYRVGDLDRTIKFYTECFGMKVLRKRDIPEEKYSNAFLGFGPEESQFVVYKLVEEIKAKGGTVTREPGPVKGGSTVIAFVKDPDGYLFEILQRECTPEPLCQVMLRVGDLERSIKFYEKFSIAMMGYAPEHETVILELTYNYGVTEYTKGNAYAQPGPIPGLNTKISSFVDPGGWKTVLVDNQDFLKELESAK